MAITTGIQLDPEEKQPERFDRKKLCEHQWTDFFVQPVDSGMKRWMYCVACLLTVHISLIDESDKL